MMNCCWNFWGNSRVHVVIPIRPRLFPLAPFTLSIFVCTNIGLGCSLSKHALDMHGIVAPALNRDIVWILFIVRGKFMANIMLLKLTSVILSSVHDSHSESNEESKLLSGLPKSWGSLISSGSDFVFLDICVCPVMLLTWSLVLCVLHVCLSEWSELLWVILG